MFKFVKKGCVFAQMMTTIAIEDVRREVRILGFSMIINQNRTV